MRKKIILLFILLCPVLFLQCKKCKEGENKEFADIPIDQKNAIFRFSEGTRWVFKSNGGEMDTVYLGPLLYSYDDAGYCKDEPKGCCTKVYSQIIRQKFNTILDSDGLDKIDYHMDKWDHWLIGKLGENFSFSKQQEFYTYYYKKTLIVKGITLTDVESRFDYGVTMGDIGIDAAYWSLSKGLVRYDYQKADGSFIIYERQDL